MHFQIWHRFSCRGFSAFSGGFWDIQRTFLFDQVHWCAAGVVWKKKLLLLEFVAVHVTFQWQCHWEDYAVVMLYMHIQMAWPQVAHLSRDSLQQQSAPCLLLLNTLGDNSHYSLNKYGSISFPLTFVWEQIYTAVRRRGRCSMSTFLRKRAPSINCTYVSTLSHLRWQLMTIQCWITILYLSDRRPYLQGLPSSQSLQWKSVSTGRTWIAISASKIVDFISRNCDLSLYR